MTGELGEREFSELADIIREVYESFTHSEQDQRKRLHDMTEAACAQIRELRIPHCTETCLMRFIDGEMDFQTPGSRGPGRSTEFCPRFAALHREMASRLSEQEKDALRTRIKVHILCGYTFAEVVMGITDRVDPLPTGKELYERLWMQLYYTNVFNVEPLSGSKEYEFYELWHAASCEPLHDAVVAFGGTWCADDLLICTAYFNGGLRLRHLESKPIPESELRDLLTYGLYSKFEKAEQERASGVGCLPVVSVIAVGFEFMRRLITSMI